jgi:vacuolar iron transporter family protein
MQRILRWRADLPGHSFAERHRSQHIGWLRAAVLGANDGIISTASLILGVAAAHATSSTILTTGVAGLIAGSLSMAAGEYVSVSSQADTEKADIAKELHELETDPDGELRELAAIYRGRGLDADLAMTVATQLTAHDPLGSHARDELGISEIVSARPLQAAVSSAASFAIGAVLPLILVLIRPAGWSLLGLVSIGSILCLVLLGMLAAQTGGANIWRSVVRVTFWGAIAMAITWGVGQMFGTMV